MSQKSEDSSEESTVDSKETSQDSTVESKENSEDDEFHAEYEDFSELFNAIPISDGEEEQDNNMLENEPLLQQLKDKNKLVTKSRGHTKDQSGQKHKAGIKPKWKRYAKKLVGELRKFSEVQQSLWLRSRGKVFLQSPNQLKAWCSKEYGRGDQRMRAHKKKENADPTSTSLADWFSEKRKANVRVSVAMLKRQASFLNGGDLPRWWISKWKQRYNVVYRAIQRRTTKSMEEVLKLLQRFHEFVYGARLNNVVSVYVNFDEVPFSYSGQMSGGCTLEYKGAVNVMSGEDPMWDKRSCSYIPCLCIVRRALGFESYRLPCSILFRRTAKKKWTLANPKKWLLEESPSGVVNTQFIAKTFLPWLNDEVKRIGMNDATILCYDSASGHKSKPSVAVAKTMFQLCVFPGGTTQFLQPVDVGYAGKLRFEYQALYHQWLAEGRRGGTSSKDFAERMMKWLGEAHETTLASFDLPGVFSRTGISSHESIKILNLPYTFAVPCHVPAVQSETHESTALRRPTIPGLFERIKRQREDDNDAEEVKIISETHEVKEESEAPPRQEEPSQAAQRQEEASRRKPGRPHKPAPKHSGPTLRDLFQQKGK